MLIVAASTSPWWTAFGEKAGVVSSSSSKFLLDIPRQGINLGNRYHTRNASGTDKSIILSRKLAPPMSIGHPSPGIDSTKVNFCCLPGTMTWSPSQQMMWFVYNMVQCPYLNNVSSSADRSYDSSLQNGWILGRRDVPWRNLACGRQPIQPAQAQTQTFQESEL